MKPATERLLRRGRDGSLDAERRRHERSVAAVQADEALLVVELRRHHEARGELHAAWHRRGVDRVAAAGVVGRAVAVRVVVAAVEALADEEGRRAPVVVRGQIRVAAVELRTLLAADTGPAAGELKGKRRVTS